MGPRISCIFSTRVDEINFIDLFILIQNGFLEIIIHTQIIPQKMNKNINFYIEDDNCHIGRITAATNPPTAMPKTTIIRGSIIVDRLFMLLLISLE